jgi:hypothetical protein
MGALVLPVVLRAGGALVVVRVQLNIEPGSSRCSRSSRSSGSGGVKSASGSNSC